MWQGEVLDVLFQQGLDFSIEEKKPDGVGEEDWKIINLVDCGTINLTSQENKSIHTRRKHLQINYGIHWRKNS